MTGAIGGGVALSSLGLNLNPTRAYADELSKMDRIKSCQTVDDYLRLLFLRLRSCL